MEIKIAAVGDIHGSWSEADNAFFNASDYDLVLLAGDLSDFVHRLGLRVARRLAGLKKPALLIPGNHDATGILPFGAEFSGRDSLIRFLNRSKEQRVCELDRALGPVELAGYSRHGIGRGGMEIDVIAARPHSMGGGALSFAPYLERRFGVDSHAASVERLHVLIDESPAQALLFFAHNGPAELGAARDDIWGRDFKPEAGDFGDPDLAEAVAYARSRGKRVLAVVAGHMHHALQGGGERRWLVRRDGTAYVNAARVPRIFREGEGRVHHHVEIVIRSVGGGSSASGPSKASGASGADCQSAAEVEVREVLRGAAE